MSGTLSKSDVQRIFSCLDQIRDLTDLLRREHFEVPFARVYNAIGGEVFIREVLMNAIVADVAVEQPEDAS